MNGLRSPRNWLRLAWGTTLLAVPPEVVVRLMARPAGSDAGTGLPTAVVRVLGVRHVAQGVLGLLLDGTRVSRASRLASAALDLTHVASLPLLAKAASPADRRLVAIDAPVEVLLTGLQVASAKD
ncbi:MAG TPA: hypothetical protein VHO26_03470 [Propionibacteriaceae bacterium]|nr:hypothetical protein [Propionibacteriaceae bacterium]